MIENIITFIALGWFIVEFEPFQLLINWLKSKSQYDILDYLLGIFECWQCSTFWATLLVSQSFKMAIVSSFVTYIIDMLWNHKR